MLHTRDAVLEDLPIMLDIYNEAVRDLTATFDLEEQTLEERKSWFSKHGEKYPLIVAELDGQASGYCGLSSFRGKPGYAYTAEVSVYVSSIQQGKGIGSVLLKEILQRAFDLGYHTIIGGISGDNPQSVQLHKKFGFTYAGSLKEVGYKFGEWQDVHFYQYIIRP
ncbi:N-acetyltransferase family protein [Halobacillus sp. A1]|uniref:GNAT family N-acetyltransferase n=1 Tax=Halobacillus sp. A1 TaxID=2880262 RepID=UPI0020A6B549|nr:GNAT family N-acetyltransferase [Halobacillus sp. A1]MCP3032287.1 N-acetyltransferase family protein [Halobacillus sp. A1]